MHTNYIFIRRFAFILYDDELFMPLDNLFFM